MATFLFDRIIFGPVKSRRLGVSLGINLLPAELKICNYDCIYCECGWTDIPTGRKPALPSRNEVKEALGSRLKEMIADDLKPDVITFAGNGEPTMHPDFEGIIDDTLELRNELCPDAGIAVLSNATLIHKPGIARALARVDQNILKLDTTFPGTFNLINKAAKGVTLERIIRNLEEFRGSMIIQTLFLKGEYNGIPVDNTTEEELAGLIGAYSRIRPEKIMIYTFERDTPADKLEKVSAQKLSEIRKGLESAGFLVEVSV
jgi:wyosine [tRNA(Phe)-imidazoG37] synthetase (radical SAM superfamily)